MSSKPDPSSRGPVPFVLDGLDTQVGPASGWQVVERRVLMTKLNALEQKAHHLQQTEDRLRELAAEVESLHRLRDAAQALHGAADLRHLLDVALHQCAELAQADKASLLLHEEETRELVVVKTQGTCALAVEGLRVPVGQGVAGYVALHREPLHVADIHQDGRFAVRNSGRYATGSFLCVPVHDKGTLLGVLNVADRRDGQPFAASDLRVIVTFARELAVALARVRHVETSRAQQRQLLSKLAHELRNPLDGALRFVNLTLADQTLADQSPEETRRRYLLATRQGLERLAGIVSGLTDLGHSVRAGHEPAQVNDLILQALALQEGKTETRGVRVELDLAEGLPPVAGGAALFQVVTNLVSNACDAMEAGGGTLTVRSRLSAGSAPEPASGP